MQLCSPDKWSKAQPSRGSSATSDAKHSDPVARDILWRARVAVKVNEVRFSADMTFGEAAELFIDLYSLDLANVKYRAPRTLQCWREYARALSRLFHQVSLKDIHWWDIHAYHEARAANSGGLWVRAAGANKILQEACFLRRVLVRAGAWTPDHDANYIRLRFVESDIPRALTPDEQNLWVTTAAKKPEWRVVYYYSIIGFATAINHIEQRQLRRADSQLAFRILGDPLRLRQEPLSDSDNTDRS